MTRRSILTLVSLLSISTVFAQPPDKVPSTALLQRLEGPGLPSHGSLADARASLNLTRLIPVQSHRLTPGTAIPQQRRTRLLQPLFLVGSDPVSLAWLTANRARLTEQHAVGLLVEAESVAALEAVRQAAQGIALLPASGDAFAENLGITHYPVLITAQGFGP